VQSSVGRYVGAAIQAGLQHCGSEIFDVIHWPPPLT
jgi:hypothetical protein